MKWSWKIDQRAVLDGGFDLDVIDLSIFELLKDFAHSPACKSMNVNGKTFYLFNWKLVIDQMPILKLNTKRSVTKRYEKLIAAGIVEPSGENKALRQMWYCFGENYDKLIQSTRNESAELGTNIPSTRNESSRSTRNESSRNNNNKEYNSINDKGGSARFQPPTKEEVISYLIEFTQKENFARDEAEKFHDHFTSNGWKVSGRTKMKDWEASARNWVRRSKDFAKPNQNGSSKNGSSEPKHGIATVESIKRAAAKAAHEIRTAREQADDISDLFAWAEESAA